MTERIQKAIDIFLDAINNGTIAKGTCTACAVGNLVAHGLGGRIMRIEDEFECTVNNSHWGLLFTTTFNRQAFRESYINDPGVLKNVQATDFTAKELAAIEFAFETNTKIDWPDYPNRTPAEIRADQIKGLEAVVKVMLQFDEQPEDVKTVFTSKAELIPV